MSDLKSVEVQTQGEQPKSSEIMLTPYEAFNRYDELRQRNERFKKIAEGRLDEKPDENLSNQIKNNVHDFAKSLTPLEYMIRDVALAHAIEELEDRKDEFSKEETIPYILFDLPDQIANRLGDSFHIEEAIERVKPDRIGLMGLCEDINTYFSIAFETAHITAVRRFNDKKERNKKYGLPEGENLSPEPVKTTIHIDNRITDETIATLAKRYQLLGPAYNIVRNSLRQIEKLRAANPGWGGNVMQTSYIEGYNAILKYNDDANGFSDNMLQLVDDTDVSGHTIQIPRALKRGETESQSEGGTGAGLDIVRQAIMQLGGRIEIGNEPFPLAPALDKPKRQGAFVKLIIPLSQKEAA